VNDLDKALDEVFSLWIRCRGSWSCMNCGAQYDAPRQIQEFAHSLKGPTNMLDCSHFWGKGSSGFWTRWNELCADSLCRPCHVIWEKMKQPGESYYQHKKNELGDHVFNFMDWLSTRVDPMHPQVKEFRLFELISMIGSRGYPTDWLYTKHGHLIAGLPGGTICHSKHLSN